MLFRSSFGTEVFTHLDYADEVALLAEMLSVLVLALEVMREEARPFGLEISWSKTKIQTSADLVDLFTYLGRNVDRNGSSEVEITRRVAITLECMKSLDHQIWRSSISVATKIRLYTVYVLPVLLYGAETWTMTKATCAKVDAFDYGVSNASFASTSISM